MSLNQTPRRAMFGLLAGAALGLASASIADPQPGPGTPDGPSTANGGALTSCKSNGVLTDCKPSSQVATTPVAKPDGATGTGKPVPKHSAHGDSGNHGTSAGPGSGSPGGSSGPN